MKKSERINQELFFLNEHKKFNLSDLMEEFQISKSTALRDIQSLENLGVPLYVDNGRYGGYQVIHQALLPPIYFNEKEISAIFFSLQLLKSVIDSPFKHSYEQIKKKLSGTFDEKKQLQILRAMESVRYEGISQIAATDNLEELFESILKEQLVTFNYTRYEDQEKEILPLRLTIVDGFWYCTGYDIVKKEWRTYRCDFIEIIKIKDGETELLSKLDRRKSLLDQQDSYRKIPFKVNTTSIGKEYFLKHKFSNMSLLEEEEQIAIVGKINEQELNFLANYLLGFGEEILIEKPEELKKEYLVLLEKMMKKYQVSKD